MTMTSQQKDSLSIQHLLEQTLVEDVMQTNSVYLQASMSLVTGLTTLIDANQQGAAVIDANKQHLLGYIELQDLLRGLWSEEFKNNSSKTVENLMQLSVNTIKPGLSLAQLIDPFIVDRQKLFNVNDSGTLIDFEYISYPERLRQARSDFHSVLTVVEDGQVLGIISRELIAEYLAKQYIA